MQVQTLTRVFAYNGMELPDPDATRSPAQVKDVYAAMYPELTTAEVEGPVTKGDRMTYTFKRSTGTKGKSDSVKGEAQKVPFADRLAAIAAGQPDPWQSEKDAQSTLLTPEMKELSASFRRKLSLPGEPLQLPSSAIALLL